MKKIHIAGTLGLGVVLALGGTAFAQTGTSSSGSTGNRATTTTVRTEERQDSPDYGWLGLLGLAGLAGLLKKPERQVVVQETHPVNPPVHPPSNTNIR